jgi:hypothetical protein
MDGADMSCLTFAVVWYTIGYYWCWRLYKMIGPFRDPIEAVIVGGFWFFLIASLGPFAWALWCLKQPTE